jgi:hypothetical protein
VIKDRVAVIVFNNKEVEKLAADIKEKIACAESSGMAGQREYDVLSQCFGRPEQPGCVRGVSSYQVWKYAWPQQVKMYRKRKRTKTDASVDTEIIKEQIKQELWLRCRCGTCRCRGGVLTNVQSRKPFTCHTEEQMCVRG